MAKSWEKLIPNKNSTIMRGFISEEHSGTRGTIYKVEGYYLCDDGNRGADLMLGIWHDTLKGAKKLFDKDYDIDPKVKHKWKQIKV